MKIRLLITLAAAFAAYTATALELSLLDPASPDWKKSVSNTAPGFRISVSEKEPGVLILEAKLDANSKVIKRKEWHGFTFTFAEPIPAGRVKFDFKPETMTTLWINVAGKAPDGSARRLDKPVNMYGSNIAKPGVWTTVEIDTTKAHIVGGKGSGALESFTKLELRLHPSKYTKPGTYRAQIRNLRCDAAE